MDSTRNTHSILPSYADVNECLDNNGGCHSARVCSNTPGSRTCGNCDTGWTTNGATGCNGKYMHIYTKARKQFHALKQSDVYV